MSAPTWRRSANTAAGSSCAAAQFEVLEGASRSRTVVIEFPDYASAVACYHSPEYQAAAALRKGRAEFDLDRDREL